MSSAALARGRAALDRLWPGCVARWVRTTPLAIPRHSTTADEQPPAATASSDDLPCSDSREGLRATIRRKERA